MPTESSKPKTPSKEEALGTVASSVIGGLSPKDKALAVGILAIITAIPTYFNRDIQADVASMKTTNAVMVEKLERIEDTLKDSYTKSEAATAWIHQKTVDDQQNKELERILAQIEKAHP